MLGILALSVSQDHQRTKDQLKSFDERIINFITIQEHLLEIAVCSIIFLIDYPQNLTNADILGQGNLNLVSEKSGNSQGILLSIICGNPDTGLDQPARPHSLISPFIILFLESILSRLAMSEISIF